MTAEYHRRFTAVQGTYEIWADGQRVGFVKRFKPPSTRADRWMFATRWSKRTQWETGKYGIGFKSVSDAVEALFASKRGADEQPPKRDNDEQGPNVRVERRNLRGNDLHHRRRGAPAGAKDMGRKNRG